MIPETQEAAVLEQVRQDLLAEGCDVVIQPNRLMVPPFLGRMTPDAIAFGKEGNIIIEVARQSPANERRVRELSDLVRNTPGWEFRLIWISATGKPQVVRTVDREVLTSGAAQVEKLLGRQETKPALLFGWAVLE